MVKSTFVLMNNHARAIMLTAAAIALVVPAFAPTAVQARDRIIIIERPGVSPARACIARCMRQSDHCNANNGGVQSINGCGIRRTMCLSNC